MFGVLRDDDLTLRVRGSHQKAVSNHYISWNFIDGTSARLASTRLQQLPVHFPNVLAVIGSGHFVSSTKHVVAGVSVGARPPHCEWLKCDFRGPYFGP
jgi:hypothetical protein